MSEETQEQTEEKQLNFDPKEIEEQLIKMAEARAEDPVETASSTYGMWLPHYEANLSKLSTRGLRRVLNFLVKYPLHQDDIKAANEFEKEMMHLTNTLCEAKFVMIMHTYLEHSEKLYEAANTPLTEEQAAEIAQELGLDNPTDTTVELKEGE